MAVVVKEIMNRELLTLRPDEEPGDALSYVLALGVTGAPVVDEYGALVGMISLRDLMGDRRGDTIGDRMTRPAVSVSQSVSISEAGKLMGETGYHRLAVTDDSGQVVGVLSTLDVIRGLLGMPAVHPSTFPHFDPETGVIWSDDHLFEFERVEAAPDAPGVVALIQGGIGTPETIVWAEAASDVRRRLIDLLSMPEQQNFRLRKVLALKRLRFRTALATDAGERERLVTKLLAEMRSGAREESVN
ncbi:MAG: CBS domain-containing protein [Proteobacteria bacterium]|nr:CBS domain-containing protein [Pseudomonadota bacterium]